MKDSLVVVTWILSFATLVTVHVAIAWRLALRSRPRWRGLVALVVPPLAPIYGYREGWRRSAALWLIAVIVYAIALLIAQL